MESELEIISFLSSLVNGFLILTLLTFSALQNDFRTARNNMQGRLKQVLSIHSLKFLPLTATHRLLHMEKTSMIQQAITKKWEKIIFLIYGVVTWKFGLLAGIAGCPGVAAAPKIIRNNRTLSFSTFCWIKEERKQREDYNLWRLK